MDTYICVSLVFIMDMAIQKGVPSGPLVFPMIFNV